MRKSGYVIGRSQFASLDIESEEVIQSLYNQLGKSAAEQPLGDTAPIGNAVVIHT